MHCSYCNVTFGSKRAFDKHKLRATGCIPWKDMDAIINELRESNSKLKENYQHALKSLIELTDKYDTQMREMNAKLLLLEEETICWNTITIVAPFLSTNTKKIMKANIKSLATKDEIVNYIRENYPTVIVDKVTLLKKKEVEIVLLDEDATECKICFTNKAQKKSMCRQCKVCYICADCEHDQMTKYKRCAFCNTDYK